MKYLPPLPLKPEYYAQIERKIFQIFLDVFYRPVGELLSDENVIIKNFKNPIVDAIRLNRIYYSDGAFYGAFNSSISRQFRELGGIFNKTTKSWKLKNIPAEVSIAIADIEDKFARISHKAVNILDNVNVNKIIKDADLKASYTKTLAEMDVDFNKSLKSISITPQLTPETNKIIVEQWTQNLEIYIKSWTDENILKLRENITTNTFRGQRAENLVQMIRDDYHVSENKAKFLARQETSLLMSKYRETRYKDIGSQKYRWSGSNDERERHDHKELNNKIFFWNSPPIVNRQTGKRAHPGEDFNCRCVAIGIID